MNALAYLVIIQLKNRILALRRKPAKLVLYIAMVLFVVMAVVSSNIRTSPQQPTDFTDDRILFIDHSRSRLIVFHPLHQFRPVYRLHPFLHG